jgi:hypothetical protein
MRVVDTCTGADNVDGLELFRGYGEHAFELGPVGYIGLLEDGSGAGGVLLEELLRFWAEPEVGDEDIAAA